MHYPDESYVRLYTRKTLTNRMLRWEGRMVLQAMLGGEEFDRAGVFEYVGDPAECIATVTEIPLELVRVGLDRLLVTKTWTLTESAVVWPAYVEAQTCAKSDRSRQSESRKWRAATAARGGKRRGAVDDEATRTEPTLVSRPEPPALPEPPPCHAPSHPVTPSHAPSHDVTPSLDLDRSNPISDPDRASTQEREILPPIAEPAEREPPPSSATRGQRRWASFPEGWRDWSLATTAAAVALGLTKKDLAGHVDYWTPRAFPGGAVSDLDFELRRGLEGIAERKRAASSSAPPGAPPASDPYRWAPIAKHRAFARERRLDLARAVDAYHAANAPERLGTLKANDDFMRRLEWWADNGGEFRAVGALPRRESSAPDARKAVGA